MRKRLIAISVVILAVLMVPLLTGLPIHASDEPARNVILMIGDGMGAFQRQAATQFAGQSLEMDQMPVSGVVTTSPANWFVTDSAAAATAMATGRKTSIGSVSVAVDGTRLETVLERAKKNGLLAGLAVTSSVTHATPAAFAAHQNWRDSEPAIAVQLLENRVDVLFGGGRGFFVPKAAKGSLRNDERDLLKEFASLGYAFAEDSDSLKGVTTLPALGLFAEEGLNPDLDRAGTRQPSLSETTDKALSLLSASGKGFFLMVEGSQIDWACHANDPAWEVTEALAFDRAVSVARRFAAQNPGTLVIVVADHETGGMGPQMGPQVGSGLNMDALRGQKATGQAIAAMVGKNRDQIAEYMRQYAGVTDLTPGELKTLMSTGNLEKAINQVMSARAGIRWKTYSHTNTPVPLTAEGARAGLFAGKLDNTDIYRKIVAAFGW